MVDNYKHELNQIVYYNVNSHRGTTTVLQEGKKFYNNYLQAKIHLWNPHTIMFLLTNTIKLNLFLFEIF